MRKFFAALFAFLACSTALSQDLLECLDPAVLQGVVRNPMVGVRDAVVTRNLPVAMGDVDVPDGFQLIASAVGSQETTVAYRSTLNNVEALDQVLELLERGGWEVQGSNRTSVYYQGNENSPQPSFTGAVCRDGQRMTIGSRDIEGESYVNYHIYPNNGISACGGNSPLGFASNPFGAANTLERYMPSLQFPVDPATGNATIARGGGSGSSGSSRYSTTQVSLAMPVGELARFLGAQLLQEGWSADSIWEGSLTAGSTFTRQPDANSELMAKLEVLAVSETVFDVTFQITQLNEEAR